MNPLCWDVLLLETHGDRYAMRHGRLSNAPALIPADRCPSMSVDGHTTAPLTRVAALESAEIHWSGEFSMSKQRLGELVAMHCDAAALMRFARAPFATELDHRWVMAICASIASRNWEWLKSRCLHRQTHAVLRPCHGRHPVRTCCTELLAGGCRRSASPRPVLIAFLT